MWCAKEARTCPRWRVAAVRTTTERSGLSRATSLRSISGVRIRPSKCTAGSEASARRAANSTSSGPTQTKANATTNQLRQLYRNSTHARNHDHVQGCVLVCTVSYIRRHIKDGSAAECSPGSSIGEPSTEQQVIAQHAHKAWRICVLQAHLGHSLCHSRWQCCM